MGGADCAQQAPDLDQLPTTISLISIVTVISTIMRRVDHLRVKQYIHRGESHVLHLYFMGGLLILHCINTTIHGGLIVLKIEHFLDWGYQYFVLDYLGGSYLILLLLFRYYALFLAFFSIFLAVSNMLLWLYSNLFLAV